MNRENELKSVSSDDEKDSPFLEDFLKRIWKNPKYEHEPDIVVLEEF